MKINLTLHKGLIIAVILVSITAVFSCKQENKETPLSGKVTFFTGRVLINNQNARSGQKVVENDLVEVKDKSTVIINFAKSSVLALKANSKIRIEKLVQKKKPVISIFQLSGTSFSKIKKGQAEYRVVTHTAVASVRGTAFLVKVESNKKTGIQLLHGKVEVKQPKTKQSVVLRDNQKITATEKKLKKPVALSKKESTELRSLDKLDFDIKKIDVNKDKPVIQVLTAKEKAKFYMPLSLIKKKYGRLSKIVLKNGSVYIGAYSQTGSKFRVITPNGIFVISGTQVKIVTPY